VSYAFTTIPTYPSGQIGFMICSKAQEGQGPVDPRKVQRQVPEQPADSKMQKMGCVAAAGVVVHGQAFEMRASLASRMACHCSLASRMTCHCSPASACCALPARHVRHTACMWVMWRPHGTDSTLLCAMALAHTTTGPVSPTSCTGMTLA
jgi:hypothetical protein